MKSIALVYKEKDIKFLKNIDAQIICMDPSLSKKFKEKNLDFIEKRALINIDEIPFIIDQATLDISTKWVDKVSNSEEFKNNLTFKNIPLWLTNNLGLELYLQKVLGELELQLQIIEKINPEVIYVAKSNDFPENIVEQIAFDRGITVKHLGKRKPNLKKYSKYIKAKYFKNFIYNHPLFKRPKKQEKLEDKKNILVVAYTHLDPGILKPLIKPLQEKYNLTILALETKSQKTFSKWKIPFKTFGDYKIKIKDKSILQKIKASRKTLMKDQEFKNNLVYKDIHLFNLIKDELNYTFKKHLPEVIYYNNSFKIIMEKEKIDLLLLATDVLRAGKVAVKTADNLNIPSLEIQAGAIFKRVGRCGYVPVSSTKMAVWGESAKNFLIDHKVPKEKLIITGCPKFDSLQQKFKSKKQVFKDLNLDINKKLLLYTTNVMPEQREMFTMVYETVKMFPYLQLVVKLHPVDNEEFYQNLAKEKGWGKINCIKDYNLYSIINATDILASKSSTVTLESLIMKKPTITINLTNQPDRFPFIPANATLNVYKYGDMKQVIQKILTNKTQKSTKEINKFIKLYLHEIDGKSTERVLNLINKMI